MINLKKQLTTFLKYHFPNVIVDGESVSRVHYQTVISNPPFPYVVFNLPNSFGNDEQEIFSLDIDIWDNETDTTVIETLASTLWKELNHYSYLDEHIQFTIYRENRLPELDESEIGLRRRKLIFQLRYFDKHLLD